MVEAAGIEPAFSIDTSHFTSWSITKAKPTFLVVVEKTVVIKQYLSGGFRISVRSQNYPFYPYTEARNDIINLRLAMKK